MDKFHLYNNSYQEKKARVIQDIVDAGDQAYHNCVQMDSSRNYLQIDPLIETPPKVIALQISLDFANLFVSALDVQGFKDHAKLLKEWVDRIDQREEPKLKSILTVSSTEAEDE